MDDPNEGLLGIGTRWGTSEPAPPRNVPATRSLGRLPADAPGCLLIVDMALRLDRIKGQNSNVDAKVQAKRASLNLGAETYNDLCDRLRNVSDNQLKRYPIYYRAIVLELEARGSGAISIPVPGLDATIEGDTVTIRLSNESD